MREKLDKTVSSLSESLGKLLAAIEPALRGENVPESTAEVTEDKLPRSMICGQLEDLDLRISRLTFQINLVVDRLDLP